MVKFLWTICLLAVLSVELVNNWKYDQREYIFNYDIFIEHQPTEIGIKQVSSNSHFAHIRAEISIHPRRSLWPQKRVE
jgi:hypothetical protein